MKTTSSPSRKSSRIRRWAVPASLALAMVVLPAATSTAEASPDRRSRSHDRYQDRHHDRYRDNHHRGHRYEKHRYARGHRYGNHRHYATSYRSRHFRPVRVNYYRPHRSAVSFYLEVPFVFRHGPRVDAQVVYYPGDVPLYEPGYCPSEVHYHPYEEDYRSGFRGSVNIRIGN